MTRTITDSMRTAIRTGQGELVYFFQFLDPPTTGGTLTRVSSGLEADIETSALANLNDFTDLDGDGAWALTGGRIEATYPGSPTRSRLRYDGIATTVGKVIQAFSTRDANVPGDPANSSGFPAAISAIGTSGVGAERWVTTLTSTQARLMQEANVACGGTTPPYGNTLDTTLVGTPAWSIHYLDPGFAEFRHFNALDEAMSATVATMPADGPCGLWVRWGHCDSGTEVAFPQSVGFTRLTVMSAPRITCTGLPPGWSIEVTGPIAGFTPISGGSGLTGFAEISFRATAMPAGKIEAKNDQGVASGAEVADGLISWGDVYRYDPPAESVALSVCSHDDDVLWNGTTYTGLGLDNIDIGQAQETTDLRAQRHQIGFSCVDRTKVLDQIAPDRHRGGVVRVWQGHVDGTPVTDPVLLTDGYVLDGLVVEEKYDDRGRPRGAFVTLQVSSPFADFDQNPGIATNERSHARWYPGDTGMQNVPKVAGKRVFWGAEDLGPGLPWVNQHRPSG